MSRWNLYVCSVFSRAVLAPRRRVWIVLALLATALAAPQDARAGITDPGPGDRLSAGVGRADITPPTGYFMLGWARGDARIAGQHTRLFARALVLKRGERKVALVAADLNSISGGIVTEAVRQLDDLGYTERDVVVSAGHTHAGPTGYFTYNFKNSVFPTPKTPKAQADDIEPQLYAFMARRLALAIRRAHADLAPAVAAWGTSRLSGVTRNRSLEAHLADHGVQRDPGTGHEHDDPGGYEHTIEPEVDVLRVDKVVRRRRVPVAAWSTFANHGTVNRYTFGVYNADHHGAAERVVEDALRRDGRVPSGQDVVNVYGNTVAGDMSAGLERSGPAAAEWVGRQEAAAMLAAWRAAKPRLTATPELDMRWTRVCFCGQETAGGRVDDHAVFGLPYFTGSEEGRGPLYDATHEHFEGRRSPVTAGVQGNKLPGRSDDAKTSVPTAIPLAAVRVGDGLVLTAPGEMTVEMGRRVRAAALEATQGSGVERAVIAGYANEYVSYFTTPEEYGAQHYEGGTTVFGPNTGNFVLATLRDLSGKLARGEAAPAPHPFDPTRGIRAEAAPYPTGPAEGRVVAQPSDVQRLQDATLRWRGGASGIDRPLDASFVAVQRRVRGRWRTVDTDLGLRIVWRVADDEPDEGTPEIGADERGTYTAEWEPGRTTPAGRYRFLVTANRYRLASRTFTLRPARSLMLLAEPQADGTVPVRLAYPAIRPERDVTYRPERADGGRLVARAGGRRVRLRAGRGGVFRVPVAPGSRVTIAAGAARDRFGNVNAEALTLSG